MSSEAVAAGCPSNLPELTITICPVACRPWLIVSRFSKNSPTAPRCSTKPRTWPGCVGGGGAKSTAVSTKASVSSSLGSACFGITTRTIGSPNALAKAKSRSS